MDHRLFAYFRFYEELNDFLPLHSRKKTVEYRFSGSPAIKDAIEAIGIPHTEVDLILVNGQSVDFTYRLADGDQVSVYPIFESLDITPVNRLRPAPLRDPKFMLDEQLGTLAGILRLLGFDVEYCKNCQAYDLIQRAEQDKRIILTRNTALLKNKRITRGYWVRSIATMEQAAETLQRFDLYSLVKPFSRCSLCNGRIEPVNKSAIEKDLPPRTRESYDHFYQCKVCRQLYWKGSHYKKLEKKVKKLMRNRSAGK
jgi:uncharacterized protein with PIN domain